jgi:hypothetical protein
VPQTAPHDLVDHPPHLRLIQCPNDVTGRIDPLRHAEAILRDRRWPLHPQRVQPRAILPADQQHVLEPLGGHERHAFPRPLQQRVGRHGRPVHHLPRPPLLPHPLDRFDHTALERPRRRRHFHDVQRPAVAGNQVGECPPDVDADDQLGL